MSQQTETATAASASLQEALPQIYYLDLTSKELKVLHKFTSVINMLAKCQKGRYSALFFFCRLNPKNEMSI